MPTTDSNGIIRYLDSDGAPTPPVLNLGMQSVSDALNLLKRRGIFSVSNETTRAALVASETAAGRPPTTTSPIYVDRVNAPSLAHLERTQDGVVWETIFSEVGRTYYSEGSGGGDLALTWKEANNPASINLPGGNYLVVAMVNVAVSAGNYTYVESHLFNESAGLGTGQQAISPIEVTGRVSSRTLDYSRFVTITGSSGRLNVKTRTGQLGGVFGMGRQSLTAIRLP